MNPLHYERRIPQFLHRSSLTEYPTLSSKLREGVRHFEPGSGLELLSDMDAEVIVPGNSVLR